MRTGCRILVVDDESSVTDALQMILTEESGDVSIASDGAEAKKQLNGPPFDLVFTDLRLPDTSGIDLISHIKADNPETQVILMTAHGSLDVTIEAIKRGAYYYIEKPFTPDQVIMLAERALEFGKIRQENKQLKRRLADESEAFGMFGRSQQMLEIYETIRATAKSDAPVLIEGESGTGKELISTAFHTEGNRADRPFIRINCAAIPHDLIESELFGYKKGAFTGADRDKRGLIEATAGGTLLLDEIAEMPVHLQTKLLRVLQERKLRRVGDENEIDVDFRLVSSTNRDTVQATADGVLRQDLYFRISTIKIKVPPLRSRHDDLALLAERFLMRLSDKYNKPIKGLSQAAFAMLSRYDWPGNIRELESVMERAVLFCKGSQIEPEHFPEQVQGTRTAATVCVIPPFMTLDELEREAIAQTLDRTDGNVKKTAEILNLHRPTLYRKLRKFGLRNSDESILEDLTTE